MLPLLRLQFLASLVDDIRRDKQMGYNHNGLRPEAVGLSAVSAVATPGIDWCSNTQRQAQMWISKHMITTALLM